MQISREVKDALVNIATQEPWHASRNLKAFLQVTDVGDEKEEEPETRTNSQNRAFHVGCGLIADALNDAGLDIRAVLKPEVEIPWNKDSVKEYLFRPVMKIMLGKESTTELRKLGDLKPLWDTVMRHLSQHHGIEYIPFPAMETKTPPYPEYTGEPNFDVPDNPEENETRNI